MLNQVVLVGRLVRDPELQITDSGKKRSTVTLAVSRGYKNHEGVYDTDFFDCTLWTGIAENTSEYCKSGDVIGVKGRLQTWVLENEDGTKNKKMEIIAEKVTFLSSLRNENDTNDSKDDDKQEIQNEEKTKQSKKKK